MQDWVIEQFPLVSIDLAMNLCWQVCSSQSYAADRMKYKFHKIFEQKSFRTEIIRHPHSSKFMSESGKVLDAKLFELLKVHKDVSKCIQWMNQRYILDWIIAPKSSLFMERMFQEDRLYHLCQSYLRIHN